VPLDVTASLTLDFRWNNFGSWSQDGKQGAVNPTWSRSWWAEQFEEESSLSLLFWQPIRRAEMVTVVTEKMDEKMPFQSMLNEG